MIIFLCSRLLLDVPCSCGTLFFLKYFCQCEEDRSDSDSGSDSHGSDEDGFLEDDDGNMVMIHQTTTGSTQILSSYTTHVSIY